MIDFLLMKIVQIKSLTLFGLNWQDLNIDYLFFDCAKKSKDDIIVIDIHTQVKESDSGSDGIW